MYKWNPKFYFLLLICLFFSLSNLAQAVNWEGTEKSQLIGEQIFFFKEKAESLSIDEISSEAFNAQFQKSEKPILNFGVSESVYWLKFSLTNKTKEKLILEVAQALVPEIEFFYKDAQQKWQVEKGGYQKHLHTKNYKHHFQLFDIPNASGTYYVKFKNNFVSNPFKIWKKSAYEVKLYRQKIIYGIYMGIMIFVILINLFLFFSLGRFDYLHYCLLVFLYAFFSAILDGYILYLFPNLNLKFWYYLNPILNQPNGLLFCILFLKVSYYDPKIKKLAWAMLIYYTSYIFWHGFLPETTVFNLNQIHALVGILLMSIIGIRTGRRGNRLGYYFAFAYILFFAIALVEVIYDSTGKPGYLFEISHVSVGILVEVFILAYLLSKRFEWEKRDIELARADAQQKVIETTKENERIVKEQNTLLENKVQERTTQLQDANEELQSTLNIAELERNKSDKLLLNILPQATAKELKENGFAKPKIFNSVTVLFTDFINFTKIAEKMTPDKLVNDLNHCFVVFDRIVKRNGLEKIKTIGDAYMAAGGLPIANETHPFDAIKAAKEMNQFISNWKLEREAEGEFSWDVRIGIHTGQVVSGVVGMHKFSYDIWGDTVNIAARMEQNGTAEKINISKDTYEIIKEKYKCIARGKVNVKGKGKLEMYYVDA